MWHHYILLEGLHCESFRPGLEVRLRNGRAKKKVGILSPAVPHKDILYGSEGHLTETLSQPSLQIDSLILEHTG